MIPFMLSIGQNAKCTFECRFVCILLCYSFFDTHLNLYSVQCTLICIFCIHTSSDTHLFLYTSFSLVKYHHILVINFPNKTDCSEQCFWTKKRWKKLIWLYQMESLLEMNTTFRYKWTDLMLLNATKGYDHKCKQI